jgi:hypothetical protein
MFGKQKIWKPKDVVGNYINCPHCGRLLRAVHASNVMHEGTDPSGKPNRWFNVTLSDGEAVRFWEKTW